jgi:hypothetical protein
MRTFWKLAATWGPAVILGPMVHLMPVGATPPAGYGFDNTPHVLVGGGADPSYRTSQDITDLWSESPGCAPISTIGATLGQCTVIATPETNTLGNYQHDTVTQAFPAGSSQGLASLNGATSTVSYAGAVNPVPGYLGSTATGPNVDFARSSRPPKTTGGNAIGGNELTVDTFWGYAQDAIEILVFNNRGAQVQAAGGSAITPSELFHIWNCDFTQWSQVPSLGISPGSPTDGPIVPWSMSSLNSGTISSLANFLIAHGGAPSGWSPNAQACDRKLQSGQGPANDDVKQLINDPATLSTSATSVDNPENWIWWSSFGILSSFPYLSAPVRNATTFQSIPAPVNGVLPSSASIIANTYPIGRTLYHVTRKQDADCPKTGTACDFIGNPGPVISGSITDLNVTGGSSGIGGAVRELTRFICRGNANQQTLNPYTGTSYFTEITSSINKFGFTTVPVALRSAGSRCQVLS